MAVERFELVDRAGAAEAIRRMSEEDLHFLTAAGPGDIEPSGGPHG